MVIREETNQEISNRETSLSRKKRNKKLYFYNCTLTEERFKTTQEAPNPDELLSVNSFYEMNPEMDDRPENIKLEVENRAKEAEPKEEESKE